MSDYIPVNRAGGSNVANVLVESLPGGVDAQAIKIHTGSSGVDGGPVTSGNPLPVTDATAETALASILAKLADPATQATLAAVKTTLDTLLDRTPSQGQAAAAASLPVVLPADQVTAMTNPAETALNQLIAMVGGRLDIRVADDEGLYLLRRLVKICECLMVVDSNQRQRVVVETLPTLGTVTTVSTITTLNGLQSLDPRYMMSDIARSAYATAIRQNLIVS